MNSQQIDAPGLLAVHIRETQLIQRDLHLNDKAGFANPPSRVPDGVPGIVLIVVNVVGCYVYLHAKRVRVELERAAFVVIRIQRYAH